MNVYNAASDIANPGTGHKLADIPAHDPFVVADEITGTYYLYTGGGPRFNGMDRHGVLVYKSRDLANWEGPYVVFTIPDGAWANPKHGAWAPEVHAYGGRYYLFVTLHNNDRPLEGEGHGGFRLQWRGTAIAVSDSLEGPFELVKQDEPIPPEYHMTLDGTLYIDEEGGPWMVYCHEWVQTADGTIEAIRLKDDLTGRVSEPIHLFSGSEAPWDNGEHPDGGANSMYVTDGCQLYRTSGNRLVMLWSTYEAGSYVQTIARSVSGRLEGPWEQLEPLVFEDSGHGMLFQTFEGAWMLILHSPFKMPDSRCKLYEMTDTGDTFKVKAARPDLDGSRNNSAAS
ncbi:glycoside hydrolase family 43 protein [Paenibacillus sp. N4]|uniref:glycoside hydrolase family 43 protein n=1 Tax=Paenibacillus vietnamensis TaxID=2590547 RepID=UPI001CD177E1|nr:glycoside hydrolase family 43 protein [Paenibacillus vietnamensis]MCA0757328.1 glycoside hydrolase family 43 protein [Paenibacillus vietnamensis]